MVSKEQHARRQRNRERAKRMDIIYSQNVHGIFESATYSTNNPIQGKRSFTKLTISVKNMQDDQIDVYLLQETWNKNTG